ncbi:MAG TPA: OmpA family protein [Spirochaetota bacterium]|nr:OmpA family protein [Spirochaetota bacterium]HOM11017.1 OmpA family protein [Spirochaetota bacterium]
MKRIITIGIITIIILLSGFIAYLLLTDYILIRYPVLVQTNPKITFIIGDAYFRESPKAQWKVAVVGQTLYKGYEIKTDPDSRMDIRLHDNTAIQLSGNSEISIDSLTVKKLSLNIHAGSLYGKFEKLFKEHDLQVKTPTAFAAIRGTDLGFEVIPVQEDETAQAGKKKQAQNKTIKKTQNNKIQPESTMQTVVYSLSGITEVYNPLFDDQKVLLSYRNKVLIDKDKMPNNPEELTEDEIRSLQEKLNSLHFDEVLLITDKITFELGSAEIQPSSYPELDKIVEILKQKKVDVRIEGHTDDIGEAAFNQLLSEKRAESIKNYLVSKGLDPKRFQTVGYGESKPIADNKTEKGRAQNRRVEFLIIEK